MLHECNLMNVLCLQRHVTNSAASTVRALHDVIVFRAVSGGGMSVTPLHIPKMLSFFRNFLGDKPPDPQLQDGRPVTPPPPLS